MTFEKGSFFFFFAKGGFELGLIALKSTQLSICTTETDAK